MKKIIQHVHRTVLRSISIIILSFFFLPILTVEALNTPPSDTVPLNSTSSLNCSSPDPADRVGCPTTPPAANTASTSTTTANCDPNPGKSNSCDRPPVIFDATGANAGICKSEGITGVNKTGTVTCTKKLLLGPCELFELAVRAGERKAGGDTAASSYTCQEFIDPVPAETVKATTNALCITLQEGYRSKSADFTSNTSKTFIKVDGVTDANAPKYCNAIALKTTGGFEIIFSLVGYAFFIIQPLLISAGVIMIIFHGVQIMYSGGGNGEEALKKSFKQLEQVLMGLALLFLIKLFLTTINGLFFVM